MVKKANMKYVFDLDGTIADYGKEITNEVAEALNALNHVYIITGGSIESVLRQCKKLKSFTPFGMRDYEGNFSIDMAEVLGVSKNIFVEKYSQVRRRMVHILREHVTAYIGGRSTIDIMQSCNKGDIIKRLKEDGSHVIYFYDNEWNENEELINDAPAVFQSDYSVKTHFSKVTEDLKIWANKLL